MTKKQLEEQNKELEKRIDRLKSEYNLLFEKNRTLGNLYENINIEDMMKTREIDVLRNLLLSLIDGLTNNAHTTRNSYNPNQADQNPT